MIKFRLIRNIVIVSLIMLILSGCSIIQIKPVCRHTAVMAALTMNEVYPVRLAWGRSKDNWQDHVQAQALISSKWECLQVVVGNVSTGSCDNYEIRQYMSIKEFIEFEWKTGVK